MHPTCNARALLPAWWWPPGVVGVSHVGLARSSAGAPTRVARSAGALTASRCVYCRLRSLVGEVPIRVLPFLRSLSSDCRVGRAACVISAEVLSQTGSLRTSPPRPGLFSCSRRRRRFRVNYLTSLHVSSGIQGERPRERGQRRGRAGVCGAALRGAHRPPGVGRRLEGGGEGRGLRWDGGGGCPVCPEGGRGPRAPGAAPGDSREPVWPSLSALRWQRSRWKLAVPAHVLPIPVSVAGAWLASPGRWRQTTCGLAIAWLLVQSLTHSAPPPPLSLGLG